MFRKFKINLLFHFDFVFQAYDYKIYAIHIVTCLRLFEITTLLVISRCMLSVNKLIFNDQVYFKMTNFASGNQTGVPWHTGVS